MLNTLYKNSEGFFYFLFFLIGKNSEVIAARYQICTFSAPVTSNLSQCFVFVLVGMLTISYGLETTYTNAS